MKNKKLMMILLALLLIGGASVYGYHLLSNPAVNEFNIMQNPGGRLHDDFNGKTVYNEDYAEKRIYVENFTKKDKRGVPLLVRVQIKEYMEVGQGAGGYYISNNPTSYQDPIKVVGSDMGISMNRDRKDTWNVFLYDNNNPVGEVLAKYRTFRWAGEELKSPRATIQNTSSVMTRERSSVEVLSSAGIQARQTLADNVESHTGKKVYYYMPTFNRNRESLDPDVNGTIAGVVDPEGGNWTPNQNAKDIKKRYNDYIEYKVDDKKTGTVVYSGKDTTLNDIIQSSPKEIEEEHTAQELLETKVISMKQWKELPDAEQRGKFWVYDEDGWAYWAEPLQPEEATGILLKGVEFDQSPSEEWYYGISVVGEFASMDSEKTFTGITDETLYFLAVIKNRRPEVSDIDNIINDLKVDNSIFAQADKTTTLQVDVKVLNPTGGIVEKDVVWSTNDPELAKVLDGNIVRPTKDMVGKKYTLTVTSKYDKTKSKDITLYVYPADATGVVRGADQMLYVQYSNNVYRTFSLTTGEIFDEWICAGADQLIGTGDDLYQVVDAGKETMYGRHFVGPIGKNCYQYAGFDGKLGTTDDKYIISSGGDFPNDLTVDLVKAVNIKAYENEELLTEPSVHAGTDITFEAEVIGVDGLPLPIELQKLTWKCSSTNSKITQDRYNPALVHIDRDVPASTPFRMTPVSDRLDLKETKFSVDYKVIDYTWQQLSKISPDITSTGIPRKVKIGSVYWTVIQNDKAKQQAYLMSDTPFPIAFKEIQGSSTPAVENADWESNPTPWASELEPSRVTNTFHKLLEENIDGSSGVKIKERAVHSIIEDVRVFDNKDLNYVVGETRQISKQMFLPSLQDQGYTYPLQSEYRYVYMENTFSRITSELLINYLMAGGEHGISEILDAMYLTRTMEAYRFASESTDKITGASNDKQYKAGCWYTLNVHSIAGLNNITLYQEPRGYYGKKLYFYYKPAMVFYYGEDDPSKHIGTPITP